MIPMSEETSPIQTETVKTTREYIGDGVYVDLDGHALRLTTERATGTDTIWLEDFVLVALIEYLRRHHPDSLRHGR